MADPTIQTFCCHRMYGSNESTEVMSVFNTMSYNTVCLFSSTVGMLGALYQILPRENPVYTHRWYSATATRGRHIIIWLAVADLFAALGVFVRSALWLNYRSYMFNNNDVLFCAISSAWIQYFYTVTWLWTLCYAVDMKLVLREKRGYPVCYHSIVWSLPAILTSVGLSILYVPDANCENLGSLETALLRILPNYCFTYLPIVLVMIINPVLYSTLSSDVEAVIVRSYSQFTNKERHIVDSVKLKFLFINISYYVCWLPNLINGIVVWSLWFALPQTFVISLWYLMAVTNPLQALFNSIIYRKWTGASDKLYIPCLNINEIFTKKFSLAAGKLLQPSESTPLISSPINSSNDSDADVEDNTL